MSFLLLFDRLKKLKLYFLLIKILVLQKFWRYKHDSKLIVKMKFVKTVSEIWTTHRKALNGSEKADHKAKRIK